MQGLASNPKVHYPSNKANQLNNEIIQLSAEVKYDYKFFDADNKWYSYDNTPLQNTIQSFADFPISKSFKEDQPRLLITSVDIAEGKTITFDSYEKAAGIRKTEYYVESNNNISGEKGSK